MSVMFALTHATTEAIAAASRAEVVFEIETLAVIVPVSITPYSRA